MIARPLRRPGPIPFANAALQTPMPAASTGADTDTGKGKGSGRPTGAPSPLWMARPPHHTASTPASTPASGRAQSAQSTAGVRSHADPHESPHGTPLHATFLGHGVLSVRSSATGAFYRFEGHGARLPIDPRDALLLGRLTDVLVG